MAWERRIETSTELTNTKSGRSCQAGELEALKRVFGAPSNAPFAKPVRAVTPVPASIPTAPPVQQVPTGLSPSEKKCPFCAETIKAEAIVCRYCGRDLPRAASYDVPAGPPYATSTLMPPWSNINTLKQPVSSTLSASNASSGYASSTAWTSSVPQLTPEAKSFNPMNVLVGLVVCIGFIVWMASNGEKRSSFDSSASTVVTSDLDAFASTQVELVTTSPATEALPSDTELSPEYVKFLDSGKYGLPVFAGKVVNTTSRPFRFIKAECEFLNKKGNPVATGLDNEMETVAPGSAWRFEIQVPDRDDIKSARITSIKADFK